MTSLSKTLHNQLNAVEQGLQEMEALLSERRAELAELTRQEMIENVDNDALQRFLVKPYLIRPVGRGMHELAIPRFLDFQAGWPMGIEGEYAIYRVSPMIDLITPLPDWLRGELNYEASPFRVEVEGDWLNVLKGNPADLYEKLGRSKLISKRDGKRLKITSYKQFEVMRSLVRQGILPYSVKPIPQKLLRDPKTTIQLREKQQRDFTNKFLTHSSISLFATGGAGKTFFGIYAAACLRGPKIIFAPRRAILEQWEARVQTYAPDIAGEFEYMTFQALQKRSLTRQFSLVIYDEIQHMPADMGLRAAKIDAVARIGNTATPWREDGNEDLIPALCGIPAGIDWDSGEPPETTVWLVKTVEEKLTMVETILEKPSSGKTMIFVYRIDVGERLSQRLGVPFIHGGTRKQYLEIQKHDTFIISKVGDAGVSINATRVIDFDWLGGRAEAGQRGLRTQHAEERGEMHILMTPTEYRKHGKRIAALSALSFDVKVKGAS